MKLKSAQAVAAAALAVDGATKQEIGERLHISPRTTYRLLKSHEYQHVIVLLANARFNELADTFDEVLAVIRDAFTAETPSAGKDHYARLAAVGHFVKLLVAGRPKVKAPEPAVNKTQPVSEILHPPASDDKTRTPHPKAA